MTGWGTLSAGGSTPDVLMKVSEFYNVFVSMKISLKFLHSQVDVPVVSDATCKVRIKVLSPVKSNFV